jgi:hypothetical protein
MLVGIMQRWKETGWRRIKVNLNHTRHARIGSGSDICKSQGIPFSAHVVMRTIYVTTQSAAGLTYVYFKLQNLSVARFSVMIVFKKTKEKVCKNSKGAIFDRAKSMS